MPDEIDVSVLVTRGALEMDSLQLEDEGAFQMVAFGVGGMVWERKTVEGPYQHGRSFVGSRLTTQSVVGVVRVYGANWVETRVNTAAMFAAFAQRQYMIIAAIQGVLDVYVCEPADVTPVGGDAYQKPQLFENMQEYQFVAPYKPGGQS